MGHAVNQLGIPPSDFWLMSYGEILLISSHKYKDQKPQIITRKEFNALVERERQKERSRGK